MRKRAKRLDPEKATESRRAGTIPKATMNSLGKSFRSGPFRITMIPSWLVPKEWSRYLRITEHEMLITLATMSLKINDLTGHDVIEALRELGYGHVVAEAREKNAREK